MTHPDSTPSPTASLEHRITALERRLRLHQSTGLILSSALFAVVTMGAVQTGSKEEDPKASFLNNLRIASAKEKVRLLSSASDEVVTKSLKVVDDEGNVIVRLGLDAGGNGLVDVLNPNGRSRITLRTPVLAPEITVDARSAKEILKGEQLRLTTMSIGGLCASSEFGTAVLSPEGLEVNTPDGTHLITVMNEEYFEKDEEGLFTGEAARRGVMRVNASSGGSLVFLGADSISGHSILMLETAGANEGSFVAGTSETGGLALIHNKTGEDVVQILADEYGHGYVGAFNRKGMGQTLKPK